MIFSFTREEAAQIKQFEDKTIELLGLKGTRASEAWIEQVKKTDKAIISEFIAMIDSFENDHFSKLDNQTKIIENAKTTAEEAIIFTYNSFKLDDFEVKSDSFTISGFTYDMLMVLPISVLM